jgi:hypothetical protein
MKSWLWEQSAFWQTGVPYKRKGGRNFKEAIHLTDIENMPRSISIPTVCLNGVLDT